jgi:uncharacterized protein YbjT (DUF2867 family)
LPSRSHDKALDEQTHKIMKQTICLLGGTGFVGRMLVTRLTRDGYTVRVLTRRRERHKALAVNPRVQLIEADVHSPDALRMHMAGCGTVINLAGILNERGHDGSGFRHVHVELPRKVVQAALQCGTRRLLHMSALNADPAETRSHYLRTKGEGEAIVHAAGESGLEVTSFRPSVIFGPEDSFFNRFAALLRLPTPVFPLACPDSRFAPVYVGDVVDTFCQALADRSMTGLRIELCGPRVYTLRELVAYTARTAGLRRHILGLGDGLSRLQARVFEYMPGKPFSLDNYYSLQKDSVCTDMSSRSGATPVEAVVPGYLRNGGATRYDQYRRQARRGDVPAPDPRDVRPPR